VIPVKEEVSIIDPPRIETVECAAAPARPPPEAPGPGCIRVLTPSEIMRTLPSMSNINGHHHHNHHQSHHHHHHQHECQSPMVNAQPLVGTVSVSSLPHFVPDLRIFFSFIFLDEYFCLKIHSWLLKFCLFWRMVFKKKKTKSCMGMNRPPLYVLYIEFQTHVTPYL